MFTVDFHTHIGASKSDGGSATARDVWRVTIGAKIGITHAVVFPIDEKNPGVSYSRMNSQIAKVVKRYKGFIGFCRLDPHFGVRAVHELHRSIRIGLSGVKLHPRSENFSPALAVPILRELNQLRLPLILHTGHDKNSRPLEWFPYFRRYRNFPVILAHSGKDAFEEAIFVAKKLPQVYLETSTLSFHRTRIILARLGARKILFGSDFPYSHPAVEMAKWKLIWNSSQRRQILSLNALKVLKGSSLET